MARATTTQRQITWVSLALLALAGCNRFHAAPGESPAEVCVESNAGKTVTVGGYLVEPFFTLECEKDCQLYVAPKTGERSGVVARFTAGTSPNQVRPIRGKGSLSGAGAERIDESAFAILDESGKNTLHIDDPLRVTGVLERTRGDDGQPSCSLNVAKVVAVP